MPSGFGEESEQEIKEAVKPTGSSYTWEQLSHYNERHNAHVAVRGKVSQIFSEYIHLSPKWPSSLYVYHLVYITYYQWYTEVTKNLPEL